MPPRRTYVRSGTRNKVGDRDGWICGFCRTSVDRTLKWPHPRSPSTDHILWAGWGVGGTDDLSNLRVAHLACNMRNVPKVLPVRPTRYHRERAGLAHLTDEEWQAERLRRLAAAIENPPVPVPLDEAVRRYWNPGCVSWCRWHAENPGQCECAPDAPSEYCLP